MTDTAPDPTNVDTFVYGESDPADFHAPTVVEYLTTRAAADPTEFARVQDAEAAGRNRATVAAVTQEDAADAADEAYADTIAAAQGRPDVGDTLPDQEDGYTRVVISS